MDSYKRISFVLGIIASAFGILSCGGLFYTSINTTLDHKYVMDVVGVSFISLLLQIAGLVFTLMIKNKTKMAGIIMLIAGIFDLFSSFFSIFGNNSITFIICFVVFILFLIAGIMALEAKE